MKLSLRQAPRQPPRHVALATGWLITAAACAWAGSAVVVHQTPIDRALPLLTAVVVVLAWAAAEGTRGQRPPAGGSSISSSAVLLAAPLLLVIEVTLFDETLRLVAMGLTLAAAFVVALCAAGTFAPVVAVAALVVLRWIPLNEVRVVREVALLILCGTIAMLLRRTPVAVAIAVIAGLITPAVPLRALALPLAVFGTALVVRWYGLPVIRLTAVSSVVIGLLMTFFAWSGVTARAPRFFFADRFPGLARQPYGVTLRPGESVALTVPEGARGLILFGANVAGLRRGVVLGKIDGGQPADPVAQDVRIGDVADWGYARRDFFYGARNPLPERPAGQLRGYGYAAWVDGAGSVPLPPHRGVVTLTAAGTLPPDATLQVEGFEMR